MQEELLNKIVDNTSQKDSLQIIVSDDTTRFKTKFNPPIQLKKNKSYEMALVNLETYYSIPNITSKNNLFKYSANDSRPDAEVWHTITIPTGSYDIVDILKIYTSPKQEMNLNALIDGSAIRIEDYVKRFKK